MRAIETPFETGPERYQPPSDYVYARDPKLRFDQRRLALVVGFIALSMPLVLGFGGFFQNRFRTALSEYYYEPIVLGDYFVGCLIAIGALLMAYRGWTPNVAKLATLAGVAALVVAFVPMFGWELSCLQSDAFGKCIRRDALYPELGYWTHAGAAGILFAILSFFCLFVFTKVPHDERGAEGTKTPAKRRRNAIYITSGIVIAVSSIAIAIGDQLFGTWWNARNMTFWAEALILAAFGASWMTQGRVFSPLSDPRDRMDAAVAKQKTR